MHELPLPSDQLGLFTHVLYDGLAINMPTIPGACLCAVIVNLPGKAGHVVDVHTIHRHRELSLMGLLNQGLLRLLNRFGPDNVALHVVRYTPENVALLNLYLD